MKQTRMTCRLPLRSLHRLALAALMAFAATGAAAQSAAWPAKPLRFLVGYPPGGGTDLTARLVAEKLAPLLGQPVVVENRPGAGSNIAGELVARSAPDGYTLFLSAGAMATNPSLYPNMPFDPARDFAPVIGLSLLPNVIVVNAALPVRNLQELVAHAKAQPETTACASSSMGSTGHLSCELFNLQAGTRILHVPYKGSAGAVAAVLGGQVPILFDQIPSPLPHIRSGRLRAIALTGPTRNPNLPDVPTTDESGLPGLHANTWVAAFAPAGTPAPVVARLNAEMDRILKAPEVQQQFNAMGMEAIGGPPERLGQMLAADTAKWARVIKAANVKLQ
jgi:tripartite-type tricarboxylate transporter receptor subunit TctC